MSLSPAEPHGYPRPVSSGPCAGGGGSCARPGRPGRAGLSCEAAAPQSYAKLGPGEIGRRPGQASVVVPVPRAGRPSADSPSVLLTMRLLVSLFLFARQDRYDCGPPTPFNSPAQEVPHQRTHGPSERVTPVLT